MNAFARIRYRRRLNKAIDRITWRGLGLVAVGALALAVNDRWAWDRLNEKAERDLHSIDLLNARLGKERSAA